MKLRRLRRQLKRLAVSLMMLFNGCVTGCDEDLTNGNKFPCYPMHCNSEEICQENKKRCEDRNK